MKLIFLGGSIFLKNHNNVVFAWIFCMRSMTCLKMGNDVLIFLTGPYIRPFVLAMPHDRIHDFLGHH